MTEKTSISMTLNLGSVDPYLVNDATEAFRCGDGDGFVGCAYSTGAMLYVVLDNIRQLKARGIYEAALVHGYCDCKCGHPNWRMSVIEALFRIGDRDKLRAVGHPLPGPGPFVVYRGVGGTGQERHVRGMSWTSSLDVACWFATKGFEDSAVYTARVQADEVYCYSNERHEDEFICRPKRPRRLVMGPGEMQQHAARHAETLKSQDLAIVELKPAE